jgi:hypothetical protein
VFVVDGVVVGWRFQIFPLTLSWMMMIKIKKKLSQALKRRHKRRNGLENKNPKQYLQLKKCL